jgi:hypothetical protein
VETIGSNGSGVETYARTPRRHARQRVELPVRIRDDVHRTDGLLLFDATDLSVGGAFLRSSFLFEIDEELRLEFVLPSGPPLCLRARVVRISRSGPPGMGISFCDLGDHDREVIRTLLTKGA